MGKRLMLLLVFALVLGLVIPAYAEVQNIKVSGDITMYGISRDGFNMGDTTIKADDTESHAATIARLRIDADLTENVGATLRLINERDWDAEAASTSEIVVDLASITLKEFLYSPLTLTLGRQELHFGNDFIVGDPDANNNAAGTTLTDFDLSSKKAFDAVRGTLNYDPLVLDLFWAKIDENTVLGTNTNPEKDDIDLFGINARYDFGGKWKTIGETYYFGKIDNSVRDTNAAISPTGANINKKATRIHTVGVRGEVTPTPRLNLQGETAYQFGTYNDGANSTLNNSKVSAWAAQGIATYALNMKYSPVLMAIYSVYSCSDSGSAAHSWDPMFENQTSGHIINVLFNATQSQVLNLRGSIVPAEDLKLTLDYVWLNLSNDLDANSVLINTRNPSHVAHTNAYSGNRHLGDEIDLTLTYDYTADVQLGLMAGYFRPGQAFAVSDHRFGDVKEAIASIKVSF
ncbi:MAG: alginate export family protein [Candidatus Omnitrophica bacterium]|nr:alginate export family protein [Candidatus Omnitrophota bacterium]MDD5352477.1 alginate export family protein [Candidatus Omnitrophota bacterium]MDD5550075.1 alginate export family protein [Candidatus Omnitrophota bacterium]